MRYKAKMKIIELPPLRIHPSTLSDRNYSSFLEGDNSDFDSSKAMHYLVLTN